jgi:hypothetical protein
MPDTFTWTSDETFQVVNVLTGTEERYNNARWHVAMWLYPEDSLRELFVAMDVPLSEPIDLDKVDWAQVCEVLYDANIAEAAEVSGTTVPPIHPSRR